VVQFDLHEVGAVVLPTCDDQNVALGHAVEVGIPLGVEGHDGVQVDVATIRHIAGLQKAVCPTGHRLDLGATEIARLHASDVAEGYPHRMSPISMPHTASICRRMTRRQHLLVSMRCTAARYVRIWGV